MTELLITAQMSGLIQLLVEVVIFLIVAGVLFWAVRALSAAFGIPEPIRTVLIVLLVLVCVLLLVYFFLGSGGLLR